MDRQNQPRRYTIHDFMNTESIMNPSFSFNGEHILYTSDKSGIFNAHMISVQDGQSRQVTHSENDTIFAISFFPNDLRFLYTSSPGGNELNHLYVCDEQGNSRDLTPGEKEKAVFYGWSYDEQSFFYGSNQRDPKFMDVYEMDIATFTSRLLYKNTNGYEFCSLSRDKRYAAFIKITSSNDSNIYLFDTNTGEMNLISPHEGEVKYAPQAFTSDSTGLYSLTNEGNEFQYLIKIDLQTHRCEKVLQDCWDIMHTSLSHSGRYLIISTNEDAKTKVTIIDTTTNKPLPLPQPPDGQINGMRIDKSENHLCFMVNSSTSPNNLYVYHVETKIVRKLTNTLNSKMEESRLAEGIVVRYPSFDGLEIPAIYYQPNDPSDEKNPAIVWTHGGPGGQSRIGYNPLIQYIVNQGYAVIAVNNRGSSGYGKNFFQMADLKHGDVDLSDCVEAKKFLIDTGMVDERKIGIIGGSYGGYLVLAALAFRPEAFMVGVDLFGISNWVRTLRSIPAWWEARREALYKKIGDPYTDEDYVRSISPLFSAENIRKPLLVLQGANDPRVLKEESDEIVEAVKNHGVPVEYIVFDDEGHGFSKKENRMKGNRAILAFLDKYLKGD